MGRQRGLLCGLVVSCVVIMAAATIIAVDRKGGVARQPVVPNPAPASGTTRPASPPTGVVRVDVSVATLWASPDLARPVDEPSVTKPVDIGRWLSTMTVADKQWLVGKLVTQALFGESVQIVEHRGGWSKVVVTDQPSPLDPRGYPGWLPTVQLAQGAGRANDTSAIVSKPSTVLHDPTARDRSGMTVSYNTRLPVVSSTPAWTVVATPEGGQAVVASSDIDVTGPSFRAPTGAELVRAAQMFTGLDYLWAGTSGFGYDCSGLTAAVYAAHGITIPRDADAQATSGVPVAPNQLQPGDLLFYASNGGRGFIHHVAMYAGGGLIVQSPATGRTVETVPVGRAGFTGEFWGARRYLPPA